MKDITELLKPCYKVIAAYPLSRFEIGDIIKQSERKGHEMQFYVKGNSFKTVTYPEKYPALFKKLERDEENN